PFALVHVGDDAQLTQRPVAPLKLIHELWQDADNAAALGERSLGEPAHEADRAASVYYRNTLAAEDSSEPPSSILINGGGLIARGCIHAHSFDPLGISAHLDNPPTSIDPGRRPLKSCAQLANLRHLDGRRPPFMKIPGAGSAGGQSTAAPTERFRSF